MRSLGDQWRDAGDAEGGVSPRAVGSSITIPDAAAGARKKHGRFASSSLLLHALSGVDKVQG
jgi:hypothetical protein